jgi:RNA polymerase sigma factor (sigma-70 family)
MEQLFRRDAGRLTSILTRILGPKNLQLAEDVVQEAFILAMRTWPEQGMPDNPSAWLLTTARNRAIDAIRRERTRRTFADDLAVHLDSEWTLALTVDEQFGENWIRDDQLHVLSSDPDGRKPGDADPQDAVWLQRPGHRASAADDRIDDQQAPVSDTARAAGRTVRAAI